MARKCGFQLCFRTRPVDDFAPPAVAIKEKKRDMAHAIGGRQRTAFFRLDIGDEENKLCLVKSADCVSGGTLKRGAKRTIRVMDLNNRRHTLAKAAEVMLSHRRLHVRGEPVSSATDDRRADGPIAHRRERRPL